MLEEETHPSSYHSLYSSTGPSSPSSGQSTPSSDNLSSPGPATPPNLHQNTIDPSAQWLVQKFGGTSVGKFPVQIAEDIVACAPLSFDQSTSTHACFSYRNYIDQHKVAIVCSARSGSTKALGTTNLLLRASAEALRGTESRPNRTRSDTGGITPVSRALFGATGAVHSEGSQSPPLSPQSRSPSWHGSIPAFGLGLTPINGKCEKTPLPVPDFVHTVGLLRQEHITAARECVTRHREILEELEEEIYRDCDWLTSFLYALKVCTPFSSIIYFSIFKEP
jgi:aspartate kinase